MGERDALAALWDERDAFPGTGTGLKGRVATARQQLGRLRRRHREGEVNTVQAGRQLLRIGYANTLQGPVEWASRFKDARDGVTTSRFEGDQPLQRAKSPADYQQGLLWKDVLEPTKGKDPAFLKKARFLAIKTGSISDELELTSRLGVTDLGVRKSIARVNGRARELSGWVPRIPGPQTVVEPVSANRVLHLVKESAPYVANDFTLRSLHTLAAERDAGLDPVVMTELGFPRSTTGEGAGAAVDVDGVPHHHLDTGIDYATVPADRWLEDFAWFAYRKILEIRPAVIHVSSGRRGFETALVALALREKTGIPVVYEVQSFLEADWTEEPSVQEDSEVFRRRLAVEDFCLHQADAILTLNVAMRGELVARGIPEDRITLVPNGVDGKAFTPRERGADLAARHHLTGPTIGCVAPMDHRREGQGTLLKAASLLRERGIDMTCVLVGGGSRREALQKEARVYGVADRVVFTGAVDDDAIAEYYALLDIVVVPRIRERVSTFVEPMTPLEAMAMAKPVVVSDLPALTRIVDAPERGRVVTPGDPAALAEVVADLLADVDERSRLGRAGREWVQQERQWSVNGPRYRAVYQEVTKYARQFRERADEGA
ncbi:glycosyltransferase [Cellulosimicrobium funkei]|nr:glycosyltransferase [Cellulosimicrobium funkei]